MWTVWEELLIVYIVIFFFSRPVWKIQNFSFHIWDLNHESWWHCPSDGQLETMSYPWGTALIQIKPSVCDVLNNTMQHVLYICNQCFLQEFCFLSQINQPWNMLNIFSQQINKFFSMYYYYFFKVKYVLSQQNSQILLWMYVFKTQLSFLGSFWVHWASE